MDPERWQKVTGIFHAALAQDEARRGAFLAEACGSDASLLRDVRALLDGDAQAASNPDPLRPAAMNVAPGTQLGPYRIESLIGAGGMGEVYKARDTRLNRSVAIKVLPSAFAGEPELRQRFEREAQAIAALHHPNICVLHDVGQQDGFEFLVMEHLAGETLQDRLRKGPMPLEQVLRYAIEIADALHSAHRAGILHRDLKPGNIMLTKDGAKLLDFGLAKFGARARVLHGATAVPTTPRTITAEGTIVGTFQYMAPEQLEGKDADERTDLFAFGAVLYEVITGRPAFAGDSRSSLIASILRDEPPPLSQAVPLAPPALELVVRACLAKDPDARLQSARDVALQLRWIQSGTLIGGESNPAPPSNRWMLATAAAVLVFSVLAAASAYLIAQRPTAKPPPTLTQLTFRRGRTPSARFTPDGQTVIFSARWDGRPAQIFSMRVDSREAQPLPVPEGLVLSVSREGQLALLTKIDGSGVGTLAQVPLGGSGVRDLLDGVSGADWLPDGKSVAVMRQSAPNKRALEFPAGTVVREWTAPGVPCDCIRVSPQGDVVAILEDDTHGGGWVSLVDRGGKVTRITKHWPATVDGLAWSPSGDEIWFGASESGLDFQVHAATRSGRERLLHQSMGSLRVLDAAPGGRALLTHDRVRRTIMGLAPGEQHERDLSWLDFGGIVALSADGRLLSIAESGVGAGSRVTAFVRPTDGSPAIRFGNVGAGAISPDGKYMLSVGDRSLPLFTLLPVGAGAVKTIDVSPLTFIAGFGAWLQDGKRIVFVGQEQSKTRRIWVTSVEGGTPRAVTPEGIVWAGGWPIVVTPDSRFVVARDRGRNWLYPIEGGERQPLHGANAGELPLRFTSDGRAAWLLDNPEGPNATIFRLDLQTGNRTPWREISVDPAGFEPGWFRVAISADGNSYVYGFNRWLDDLYLVDGIR